MNFRVRENTWDARIVEMVRVQNEYNLPDDMSGWTVVDIGAHIGAFARACTDRSAKKVLCFEPDPENFALLAENTEGLEEVAARNVAVMDHATAGLGIRRLTDHDGDARNTGHVDIFGGADGTETIDIADILRECGKVDLLKLDCEGAEWFILRADDLHPLLANVERIVAELHAPPQGEHPLLLQLEGSGLDSLSEGLTWRLRAAGFAVNVQAGNVLGKLVAERIHERAQANGRPMLLWSGDAVTKTGYARVTHNICSRLKNAGWDVRVLGIGFSGDPHNSGFPIYPAFVPGGDPMGIARMSDLVKKLQPQVVCIHNDSWNVAAMVERLLLDNVWAPIVGYVAVDSKNVRSDVANQLRQLKMTVGHTEFAIEQLRLAGHAGPACTISHGVDREMYGPYLTREQARKIAGLTEAIPDGAFLWGSVNANQPRKRLDLVIAYFAAWWKQAGCPKDAFLYLHTDKHGAWDLGQIAEYCGVRSQVIRSAAGAELSEAQVSTVYSCFDAQLSVAEGESWGLTHLEGMACGVPQIAVRCGGMPEWAGDSIRWVEPSAYVFTPNRSNSLRAIAAEGPFVEAMEEVYRSAEVRARYSELGAGTAAKFSWDDAASKFDKVFRDVLAARKAAVQSEDSCMEEFSGAR